MGNLHQCATVILLFGCLVSCSGIEPVHETKRSSLIISKHVSTVIEDAEFGITDELKRSIAVLATEVTGSGEHIAVADLQSILRAAHFAYLSTHDFSAFELGKQTGKILAAKNRLSALQKTLLAEMFMTNRDFEELPALLPAWKNVTISRNHALGRGVSAWQVTSPASLVRTDVQVKNRFLVVVSHPLCAYSRAAASAIANEEALRSIMAEHAVYLAPADATLDLSIYWRWNERYPDFPIILADKRSDWPEIDQWSTPIFYFFDDGNVKQKIIGWPNSDRLEVLRRALQQHGYLSGGG